LDLTDELLAQCQHCGRTAPIASTGCESGPDYFVACSCPHTWWVTVTCAFEEVPPGHVVYSGTCPWCEKGIFLQDFAHIHYNTFGDQYMSCPSCRASQEVTLVASWEELLCP
jgi:hypothetical protein